MREREPTINQIRDARKHICMYNSVVAVALKVGLVVMLSSAMKVGLVVMLSSAILLSFLHPASHALGASISSKTKRCFALKDKQKQRQASRLDITERYIRVWRGNLAACSIETFFDFR